MYTVAGMCWNGHGWESVSKMCKTIESALGAASLLLREVHPYQVIIENPEYKTPIPNPVQIAATLNKREESEDLNTELAGFDVDNSGGRA